MSMSATKRLARAVSTTGSNKVMLSSVPLTVTINDIKALSHKAVKPGIQTETSRVTVPRDSSTTSLAAGITSIEFLRTPLLNMSGKVVVRLQNETLAQEFANTANGKMVGGNRITARIGARIRDYPAPSVQLLADFQRRSPGRVVILKGLPSYIKSGDLSRILKRNYMLAEDTVTVDGVERHWATVADAMLLVNRWHRTIWTPRNIARQAAAWAAKDRLEGEEDEEYSVQPETEQLPSHDHWRGRLREDQRQQGLEPEDTAASVRSIIDAYIMPETTVFVNS